jgi:ABC-type amino acid transport substrate-binding protein
MIAMEIRGMRRATMILIALLGVPLAALAQSATLERIRTTGIMTLGYIQDGVPFSFLGPDRQPQGYAVDLCREVALGIRAQLKLDRLETRWVPVTIQGRVEAVRSGQIDIDCSTTTWTLSRNAAVDFSLITFVDGGSILARAGTKYGRLLDFDGKRIAVISGTTTEQALRECIAER